MCLLLAIKLAQRMKSDSLFIGFYKQGIPGEIILALWNAALLHAISMASPGFVLPTSLILVFVQMEPNGEGRGCSSHDTLQIHGKSPTFSQCPSVNRQVIDNHLDPGLQLISYQLGNWVFFCPSYTNLRTQTQAFPNSTPHMQPGGSLNNLDSSSYLLCHGLKKKKSLKNLNLEQSVIKKKFVFVLSSYISSLFSFDVLLLSFT